MNTKYRHGPTICQECKSSSDEHTHSGAVFINGYPSPCPNTGKHPGEYQTILKLIPVGPNFFRISRKNISMRHEI